MLPKNPNPDDQIPLLAVYVDHLPALTRVHTDLINELLSSNRSTITALKHIQAWAATSTAPWPTKAVKRLETTLSALPRQMEAITLIRNSMQFTKKQNQKKGHKNGVRRRPADSR